jgi:hypothetical protein
MAINKGRSDALTLAVFREALKTVNSRLSQAILLLLEKEDYRAILSLGLKDCCTESVPAFANDYMLVSFLSKWKGLATGLDTEAVAHAGWIASEQKCAETNARLNAILYDGVTPAAPDLISRIQCKIQAVIGPAPNQNAFAQCRWSKGATFDLRRGTTLDRKMIHPMTVTPRARKYLERDVLLDPTWIEALTGFYPTGPVALKDFFIEVPGNRWITVPKNAKTDRCISAEPSGNAFLQQSIGRFMRSRLRSVGVDLNNQVINQHLAKLARSERLSTLDLSSASDSISVALVYLLLPIEWALVLDDLRSPMTKVKGDWVRLAKFSSMGNAFTFELESLLFWAISISLAELHCSTERTRYVSVYGDDIIVPTEIASKTIEALSFFGFDVNLHKSFTDGLFFESCGKHYFFDEDVTPVYQKELANSTPEHIRLYNRLYRWMLRDAPNRAWVKSILLFIREHPLSAKSCQYFIPDTSQEDTGILTPVEVMRRKDVVYNPNYGYLCTTLLPKQNLRRGFDNALLAYKLRQPGFASSDPKGRGSVGIASASYVTRKRYIHFA